MNRTQVLKEIREDKENDKIISEYWAIKIKEELNNKKNFAENLLKELGK